MKTERRVKMARGGGVWKRGKGKPPKSEKYPQGWMRPKPKRQRKQLKLLDLADGGQYRKVGGWFEWN